MGTRSTFKTRKSRSSFPLRLTLSPFGILQKQPQSGRAIFRACAERGITHIECLWNLEAVVGKGRFTFIAFPLRIRGGTASPIRAVAMFPS